MWKAWEIMKKKKISRGIVSVFMAMVVLVGSSSFLMVRADEADDTSLSTSQAGKSEVNDSTEQGEEDNSTATENSADSQEGENGSTAAQPSEDEQSVATPQPFASSVLEVTAEPSYTQYQTYKIPGAGSASSMPPELVVTMSIVISDNSLVGASIKLPYTFIPNEDDYPDFNRSYDGKPFFILDDTSALDNSSIIGGYDTSSSTELVINLKDNSPRGSYTVKLGYKFNSDVYLTQSPDFYGVIPDGTELWEIQPTAYVGSNAVMTDTIKTVTSNADATFAFNYERQLPTTKSYYSGDISARTKIYNQDSYQVDFDDTYDNIRYIDLPQGSVVTSTAMKQAYPEKTTVMIDGEQYDRYYQNVKNIKDATAGWNNWNYSVLGNTFQQTDISFTPPDSLQLGETFYVGMGVEIKRENGVVEEKSEYNTYVKKERQVWELYSYPHWYTGENNMLVDIDDPSFKSIAASLGGDTYAHAYTTKNTGTGPIEGVKQEIYQVDPSQPEKINFSEIQIVTSVDISNKAQQGLPSPSQYRLDFSIASATGGAPSSKSANLIPNVNSQPYKNTFIFTISDIPLAAGEYIEKITLVPTGIDGTKEGEIPSLNGFTIKFKAKNWADEKWPNGTAMTNAEIPFTGELTYLTEDGNIETQADDVKIVYYMGPTVTSASVKLASSNNKGRGPGDLVNYTIQGVNNRKYTMNGWESPKIILGIPKVLTLKNQDEIVLQDADGSTKASVAVELIKEDDTFNYYSFTAENYTSGVDNSSTAVFTIPITLEVAENTSPGDYAFSNALVSSANAENFYQFGNDMNTLTSQEAAEYGFTTDDYYSVIDISSAVNIAALGKFETAVAVKGEGTDNQWVAISSDTPIPTLKSDLIQFKVTLTNSGNTIYENIKLVDLLPFSGDEYGSTGQINFVKVIGAEDAVIKYSDEKNLRALMNSSLDLQTESFDSWTADRDSLTGQPTGLYLDFTSTILAPEQEISIIMEFQMGDKDNQIAYNQFAYSGKEKETGKAVTFLSRIASFTSDTFGVIYEGNVPEDYPVVDALAENVPPLNIGLLNSSDLSKNKIIVTDQVPTLGGYEFTGWNTQSDGLGKDYSADDVIHYTKVQVDMLYAQWKAVEQTVTFIGNGGEPAQQTQNIDFNTALGQEKYDSVTPTLFGKTFGGWTTEQYGSGTVLTADTKITESITVYAQWKNVYLLTANNFAINTAAVSGLTEKNIIERADAQGYLQSSPGVPTEITIKESDLESAEGIYTVVFTTGETGNMVEKAIKVFVSDLVQEAPPNTEINDTQVILANHFSISAKDAKDTLATKEGYIQGSDAQAWNLQDKTPLDVLVGSQAATDAEGNYLSGTYNVEYSTNGGTKITKTVTIYSAKPGQEDPEVAIEANDFSVKLSELSSINDAGFIERASAKAWSKETPNAPLSIAVTGAETVDAIGTYPVTFTTEKGVFVTVAMTVTDAHYSEVNNEKRTAIQANDFTVTIDEARDLETEDYLKNSSVTAWEWQEDYTNVAIEKSTISVQSSVEIARGTYPVVYTTPNGTSVTAFVTVSEEKIKVDPLQREAIEGVDFVVDIREVNSLTSADYLEKGQIVAWSWDESGQNSPISKETIFVDFDEVVSEAGTYPVIYTTPKGTELTLYATVKTADELQEDKANQEVIEANNITLKVYQVDEMDDETYIRYAEAKAWNTNPDLLNDEVDITVVDASQVKPIVGEYPLSFATEKGTTVTVVVKVVENETTMVVFDGNGADAEAKPDTMIIEEPNTTLEKLPPIEPLKNGYSFTSWNTLEDGGGETVTLQTVFEEDTVVYAQWVINPYTLSFDAQNAGENPAAQVLNYGMLAQKPQEPSKTGYTFTGWFTEPQYGIQWDFDSMTMPGRNITLYAQYEAVEYTVTFDLNGAGESFTQQAVFGHPIAQPENPTLAGYVFTGWKSEDGQMWNFNSTMPARNMTLTAQWERNQYTVTYLSYNLQTVLEKKIIDVGDQVPFVAPPEVAGHHFAGWGVDGTDTRWNFQNPMISQDLVLVALYDKNPANEVGGGTKNSKTNNKTNQSVRDSASQQAEASSEIVKSEASSSLASSAASSASRVTVIEGEFAGITLENSTNDRWSVVSLIWAIIGVVMSIIAVIMCFKPNYKKVLTVAIIVVGIISAILFFLLNQLTGRMVLFDSRTIIFILTVVIQTMLFFFAKNNDENKNEKDED